MKNWISTKKRLPTENCKCMVTIKVRTSNYDYDTNERNDCYECTGINYGDVFWNNDKRQWEYNVEGLVGEIDCIICGRCKGGTKIIPDTCDYEELTNFEIEFGKRTIKEIWSTEIYILAWYPIPGEEYKEEI